MNGMSVRITAQIKKGWKTQVGLYSILPLMMLLESRGSHVLQKRPRNEITIM